MRLYIAAVNHFDPLGRGALSEWLQGLAARYDDDPAFVAVEYDADQFAELLHQRTLFRELARAQWPNAPQHLLETLESGIAYEGDTHLDIFPDSPVVWLDQGRENAESRRITMYAADRLDRLDALVRNACSAHDATRVLVHLSSLAWADARPPSEGSTRDQQFAALIRQEIAKGRGDWAIVIVGGNHASDHPGHMRRLLQDAGVTCHVSILRPCPPPARVVDSG